MGDPIFVIRVPKYCRVKACSFQFALNPPSATLFFIFEVQWAQWVSRTAACNTRPGATFSAQQLDNTRVTTSLRPSFGKHGRLRQVQDRYENKHLGNIAREVQQRNVPLQLRHCNKHQTYLIFFSKEIAVSVCIPRLRESRPLVVPRAARVPPNNLSALELSLTIGKLSIDDANVSCLPRAFITALAVGLDVVVKIVVVGRPSLTTATLRRRHAHPRVHGRRNEGRRVLVKHV
ncbi:hypothetical protein CCR75_006878 [Bremia lactucae]|uniref:Uncharacterized protein n=1 Tax=Bremia lactucae TaxID=4779 RepID=A0A976NZN1_BRELC|nr:hypothetical protein CCR75_006878 [Bremia lactucae]